MFGSISKIYKLVFFSVSQQGYVNYMYYSMMMHAWVKRDRVQPASISQAMLNLCRITSGLKLDPIRPPTPHSKKLIHSDRKAGYIGWYAGLLIYLDTCR